MAAGDITYTHTGAMSREGAFASGVASGDGTADMVFNVGFEPSYIKVYLNDTAGDPAAEMYVYEWFKGMTAGYYWETLASDGVVTLRTSGGPTVYTGSAITDSSGFTLPLALQGTTAEMPIYYVCYR